jgi:hypothetical protein
MVPVDSDTAVPQSDTAIDLSDNQPHETVQRSALTLREQVMDF